MGQSAKPDEPAAPRVSSARIVLIAIAALTVATALLLLPTGEEDGPVEAAGDLIYIQGSSTNGSIKGRMVASIADITRAAVQPDADSLVIRAEVAAPLPETLKMSSLGFRWDISNTEGPDWTLTVALDKEAQTALFSEEGYGVGTVDDTFPGELIIQGSQIEVRLNTAEIDAFPEEFEWSLTTTLRAFRKETGSPRVEDRYPDEGAEKFKP